MLLYKKQDKIDEMASLDLNPIENIEGKLSIILNKEYFQAYQVYEGD